MCPKQLPDKTEMDSLLSLIAEHSISWTTLGSMQNFSAGGLLIGFISALRQSSAASASFWNISGLCVSDAHVKSTHVQSLDPLSCVVWFLLPGQRISKGILQSMHSKE